jgi:hypothetical protein
MAPILPTLFTCYVHAIPHPFDLCFMALTILYTTGPATFEAPRELRASGLRATLSEEKAQWRLQATILSEP